MSPMQMLCWTCKEPLITTDPGEIGISDDSKCTWIKAAPWRCPKGCEVVTGPAPDTKTLVDRQAEDEGLWLQAATATEAYLQAALRELHAAVEEQSEPVFTMEDVSRLRKNAVVLPEGHEDVVQGDDPGIDLEETDKLQDLADRIERSLSTSAEPVDNG